MHRLISVVRQGLDFFVHQRFDFMRSRVADDDEAAVVADERHQVLVREQLRKVFEDLGFLRVVEMRFDLAPGLGSELPHQRMQGGEHVEEVARLGSLVEHGLHERLAAVLDRGHGVGDDENAERRPHDNDELERLKQHFEMPAKRRIAAEYAADSDHEAYGEIQDSLPVRTHARFAAQDLREAVSREVSYGQADRTIVSPKGRRDF